MEIVQQVLAIQDTLAVPTSTRCLDLLAHDFPRLLWAARSDGGGYLAVLNPHDEARKIGLALDAYPLLEQQLREGDELHDVWTHRKYAVRNHGLDLGLLPKHAVRLLPVGGANPRTTPRKT